MAKLPANIRLLKFNPEDKRILLLKEYFDSLPHIVYADYALRDKYTYYIVPNSATICHVLWEIREYLDTIEWNMISCSEYFYEDNITTALHTYEISPSAWDYASLPKRIKINPNDVKKLEFF